MFKNPGNKIKVLAIISFWVTFIGSVIAGIILIAEDYLPIGLPLLLGGFFVAYVDALLLYGFGELIDKTCDIEKNTHKEETVPQTNFYTQNKPATNITSTTVNHSQNTFTNRQPTSNEWKCTCGKIHQSYESSCICGKTKQEILLGSTSGTATSATNSNPQQAEKGTATAIVSQTNPDCIICPECGCEQKSSRLVCWQCGAKFQ